MNRVRRMMVLAGLSTAALGAAAAEPTAAQIVDKNLAARGGQAAWRAITAMTMTGELDAGGKQPTRLPYVMNLKRPHKQRLEITFVNSTAIQTFDGQQGWKYRPYLNREDIEPLTDAETRAQIATDELDGPLIDHERKGIRVALAGADTVEGRKTYKLKLSKADGSSRFLWVDAQTFLEAKIDGQPRKLDGRLRKVAVFYRDFKKVGAVMVPHTLETVVEGTRQGNRIVVKKVELNPPLDDTLFGKPQPKAAATAAG